jgi:hypothetical protein
LLRRTGTWLADLVRKQFITRNRRVAAILTVATVAIAIAAVHLPEWWFSPGCMILPILGGGLMLWPRALRILIGIAAAGLVYDVVLHRAGPGIVVTIAATAYFADVLSNTRGKLGTRGLRADRMMIELRDRIRAQGTLPELGDGWGSTVVLRPAGGSSFGGDFVVSYSDGKTLEVALVDVSGKGMDAATRALLLSGAFGGVLGSVPREQFLPAAAVRRLRRRPRLGPQGAVPPRRQRLPAKKEHRRGLRDGRPLVHGPVLRRVHALLRGPSSGGPIRRRHGDLAHVNGPGHRPRRRRRPGRRP